MPCNSTNAGGGRSVTIGRNRMAACRPPKKIAATTVPHTFNRPTSATTTAVKPTSGENPVTSRAAGP